MSIDYSAIFFLNLAGLRPKTRSIHLRKNIIAYSLITLSIFLYFTHRSTYRKCTVNLSEGITRTHRSLELTSCRLLCLTRSKMILMNCTYLTIAHKAVMIILYTYSYICLCIHTYVYEHMCVWSKSISIPKKM